MKSLLSTRAGASFFYGSNHTVLLHAPLKNWKDRVAELWD